MLRHIVMMTFKNKKQLKDTSSKMKLMLEELEKSIKPLLKMEVGLNFSNRPSAYDMVLIADFNNEDDLNYYRNHKDHIAVLDFLATVVDKTAVIDYYF